MSVQIGSVFKGHTERSWTAKPKFIIVVKEAKLNDNVLCVFVNTNRPDNPDLLEFHIPISAAKNNWLEYPSFVGCSLPFELTKYELDGRKPVGIISEELLNTIIDKIRDSYEAPSGLIKSYF